ncbi:hypothetical protein [Aquamicrobium soli]|jgi:hypothetical protein|uniref:Lipoprotein n=1 Tax=Aquamicrobium soli TaxID=1811518 RepID=A0ABV7KD44_9HYPH
MKYLVLIVALFGLGGCGANSLIAHEEATVIVSTLYDDVDCRQLLAERNGLASQENLPRDARVTFSPVSLGLGILIPDYRTEAQRRQDTARGKIMAMNDSLARRCGQGRRK